jgi:hypothetical protein
MTHVWHTAARGSKAQHHALRIKHKMIASIKHKRVQQGRAKDFDSQRAGCRFIN